MGTVFDEYRAYLVSLVHPETGVSGSPSLILFEILDSVEFRELVANDGNRISDIRDMRFQWLYAVGRESWELDDKPPSALELMIICAQTMSFLCKGLVEDSSVTRWFNEMMWNVEVLIDFNMEDLRWAVEIAIRRKYDYAGNGSFFPLKEPREDQREVEIWSQLNAYIIEKYL